MHGRKWNRALQGRQLHQTSSHYRKKSRSPPRLSRSRAPYRPSRRRDSPCHSLERWASPSNYIERNRPQSYLERSKSPVHRLGRNKSPPHRLGRNKSPPHKFGRNKSPPHSLGRSRSPGYYPVPGRRSKSPVHYRQRTRSPSFHYLEGNGYASAHYLEESQPTSHYLERSESPADYVGRNRSPSHNLGRIQSPNILERNKSPSFCFEAKQSSPHYLRSQSPAYYLRRSKSPSDNWERDVSPTPTHYLEKNKIPPDYLRRSQSPASDLERHKSSSHYLEKSQPPSPEKNQSPTNNYFRRSQSPDHYLETRNSPLHYLEETGSPTHYIGGNASSTPYSRRSMSPYRNFRRRSESSVEYTERNEYPYQYLRSSKSPPQHFKEEPHSPYPDMRYLRSSKSPPQHFREEPHLPYPDMRFDESSAHFDPNSDDDEPSPHFMDTEDLEQYHQEHELNDGRLTSQGPSKTKVFRERPLKFSMDNPKNRRHSISIKISSVEEVDAMPKWRIKAIRLTSVGHRKVKSLARQGNTFMEAKRMVIKELFLKKRKKQTDAAAAALAQLRAHGLSVVKKRPETIAVVHAGYPRDHLGINKLRLIESAILTARVYLPENGPQVYLRKFRCKAGVLLVRCLDKHSADWLREVVPQLKPWKGAVLRIHDKGSVIPKPVKCMVFVPNEEGQRVPGDVFLDRLRISNPGLNSHLWMAVGKSAEGNGILWTFNMDVESLNFLKKVDLQPFYGLGSRIKFTLHSAVL